MPGALLVCDIGCLSRADIRRVRRENRHEKNHPVPPDLLTAPGARPMGFGFQHRHGTETSLSDPVPCKKKDNNCAHGWLPMRGNLHAPNGKVRQRVRNLPLRFRLELKASGETIMPIKENLGISFSLENENIISSNEKPALSWQLRSFSQIDFGSRWARCGLPGKPPRCVCFSATGRGSTEVLRCSGG